MTEVERLKDALLEAVARGLPIHELERQLAEAFDLEHETQLTHAHIDNGWLDDDDSSI
jgi:hypothetical protein